MSWRVPSDIKTALPQKEGNESRKVDAWQNRCWFRMRGDLLSCLWADAGWDWISTLNYVIPPGGPFRIGFYCHILVYSSRISCHHLRSLWTKYWYLCILKLTTCGSARNSAPWCVRRITDRALHHFQGRFTDGTSAWTNSNASRLSSPSHIRRRPDHSKHNPVIFNTGFATFSLPTIGTVDFVLALLSSTWELN